MQLVNAREVKNVAGRAAPSEPGVRRFDAPGSSKP